MGGIYSIESQEHCKGRAKSVKSQVFFKFNMIFSNFMSQYLFIQ
jgi:hypothetical protein